MTFLVQDGTGTDLAALPGVRIRSQAEPILPPSAGARWDTPPWQPTGTRPAPLPLHPSAHLKAALRDALRLHSPALP
ncbi:hypothetical protein [Streptomyces mobaraensis]|uniref:Uncharacterized protein n=1 Tax=Streptomyces mobaraensis TaxID=35621 RepID=A0A5N5W1I2_STRMB|nr:hypothetical protein [Streptomyces mobaraensis]KAB7835522.1 hypothetical protein FRZ00_26905 [Streptomyces mobaraensis]